MTLSPHLRMHPSLRQLQYLKTQILETDIPEAKKQGVQKDTLLRCSKRLSFIKYENPYKYSRGSKDRRLAIERLSKASREVKLVRRKLQSAINEAMVPTQEEMDAERFLQISREQKGVMASTTDIPLKSLRDALIARNAAMAALDIAIGTSTGYHIREYLSAQRELGKERVVVRSAVAFKFGKDKFVSLEDERLVPYKLQRNHVEQGQLGRLRVPEPKNPYAYVTDYAAWLDQVLADEEAGHS